VGRERTFVIYGDCNLLFFSFIFVCCASVSECSFQSTLNITFSPHWKSSRMSSLPAVLCFFCYFSSSSTTEKVTFLIEFFFIIKSFQQCFLSSDFVISHSSVAFSLIRITSSIFFLFFIFFALVSNYVENC
jgi:hypothetical protein